MPKITHFTKNAIDDEILLMAIFDDDNSALAASFHGEAGRVAFGAFTDGLCRNFKLGLFNMDTGQWDIGTMAQLTP